MRVRFFLLFSLGALLASLLPTPTYALIPDPSPPPANPAPTQTPTKPKPNCTLDQGNFTVKWDTARYRSSAGFEAKPAADAQALTLTAETTAILPAGCPEKSLGRGELDFKLSGIANTENLREFDEAELFSESPADTNILSGDGDGKRKLGVGDAFILTYRPAEGVSASNPAYLLLYTYCSKFDTEKSVRTHCLNFTRGAMLYTGEPLADPGARVGPVSGLAGPSMPQSIKSWLTTWAPYHKPSRENRIAASVKSSLTNFEYKQGEKSFITRVIDRILRWFEDLANTMLNLVGRAVGDQGVLHSDDFTSDQGFRDAWGLMRGIANLFFLIVLLVIAFSQVSRFQLETYALRTLLPRFVRAIIMVNLSLLLSLALIDFADVLTKGFSELATQTDVAQLFQDPQGWGNRAGMGLWLIVLIVALLAAIYLWIILILRILIVWFLVIISPLAFLGSILPITQGLSRSWWTQFMKWVAMGPLIALILRVGQTLTESSRAGPDVIQGLLPMFAAITILAAAAIPSILGGRIVGTVSGHIQRSGLFGLRKAGQYSGLSAWNAQRQERAENRQALRGAGLTDALNRASFGRLGTSGTLDRKRAYQRDKLADDYERSLTSDQLTAKLYRGSQVERDASLVALAKKGELPASEMARHLHESFARRDGATTQGFSAAVQEAAGRYPSLVRRLHGDITQAQAQGYLRPSFNSTRAYAAAMAPDRVGQIHSDELLSQHAGGLLADEKRELPISAETARSLRSSQLESFLSTDHQNQLRQAAAAFTPTAGASDADRDQQLLDHLRGQGIALTAGTRHSFGELRRDTQDNLIRERVLKRIDI